MQAHVLYIMFALYCILLYAYNYMRAHTHIHDTHKYMTFKYIILLYITRPRDPNIPTTVNGLYYYYHHHLSPRGCVYCSGGGRQQNRIAHPAAPHSDDHTSGMFANPNAFFRPFCRSPTNLQL